ncbi:MAG: CotH kinase family protein, partial [bacterium]|nr:CotH kinase family protein [bacterium]
MKRTNQITGGLLLALFGLAGPVRAGLEDLVITEVQSINNKTITDEDGDSSDWLEIYNDSAQSVNLNGCYLTDDPLRLNKWRFPFVAVEPFQFLVVFCSDKDRRNGNSELHANFKLSSIGEFLALVDTDGSTKLSFFEPQYPELPADFSYGSRMNASFENLVGPTTPVFAQVPNSGHSAAASSLAWTESGYGQAGWNPGVMGIGYERSSGYDAMIDIDLESEMYNVNTTAWIRVPFELDAPEDLSWLTLRVKFDDGFIAYINGVKVAEGNAVGAEGIWNANASDDHLDAESVIFQEWSFPNDGKLVNGTNILAIHGLNRSSTSSDFLIVAELQALGGGSLDDDTREFFSLATPGSGNVPGSPFVLLKPILDPPCGTFTDSVAVTVTPGSVFPGSEIRYTTNGSVPGTGSMLYNGPISIDNTIHLRARVFDLSTGEGGLIASGTYQKLAVSSNLNGIPAPDGFTSNLPIMVVENFGAGGIPRPGAVMQKTRISVFERDPLTGRSSLSNPPDVCFRMGIRKRGQSSAGFSKPQYRVELRDESDEDLDYPLLGLPSDSDWVFNGPYVDKALIRNSLAFELGREIGIEAPRTKHFEMFLSTNGGVLTSSEYVGVYVLMETVKRGKDRVDIERMSPSENSDPEVTGGYLLRFEPSNIVPDSIEATRWKAVEILDPDPPTQQQRDYIGGYLDDFAATLNWTHGSGPNNSVAINNDPLTGYPAYIDIDSFVHLLLMNELLRDQDAYVRSDYMFKDRGGKLHKGPMWDLNLSVGTGCCFDNRNTSGWQYVHGYNRGSRNSHNYEPDWFVPLLRDRDFRQHWIDRWGELRRDGVLDTTALMDRIDAQADPLVESAVRNFTKWNNLRSSSVNGFGSPSTSTWAQQIDEVKTWLTRRTAWIDSQFPRLPLFDRSAGPIDSGDSVRISGTGGTIYFTLDGLDPRLPGGNVAADATRYTNAIVMTENTRLVARIRISSTEWSAPTAATYVIETPALVVTELMYHPRDPAEGGSYKDDDFEFLELMNVGSNPVDMEGFRFAEGIEFVFTTFEDETDAILQPGERLVIVSNLDAFRDRYNTDGVIIGGEYGGNLDNSGDIVVFEGALREPIQNFGFSDEWYFNTDGFGLSLSILDPYQSSNWGAQESW